ncbi:MAG TPA: hypothetical protein VFW94_08875 [Candidatus Acidoferrales bacterium]|nr:hypothetical protein [Candidatus Acidoferrales bacterium]
MNTHWPDWKRAALAGIALLALALFSVFGIQHGFEEGIGWYVTLLPGAWPAAAISDIFGATSRGNSIGFWGVLLICNFVWYFGISYAAIEAYRFVSRLSRTGKREHNAEGNRHLE